MYFWIGFFILEVSTELSILVNWSQSRGIIILVLGLLMVLCIGIRVRSGIIVFVGLSVSSSFSCLSPSLFLVLPPSVVVVVPNIFSDL